jgi:hypothetical protein
MKPTAHTLSLIAIAVLLVGCTAKKATSPVSLASQTILPTATDLSHAETPPATALPAQNKTPTNTPLPILARIPTGTDAPAKTTGPVTSPEPVSSPVIPTSSPPPTETPLPPTPRPSPSIDEWMTAPITPTVSQAAREIYIQGQALNRDPHAFSKIGDCQSITTFFLASFEFPGQYRLGTYTDLQETIDWFPGSFTRESLAVKGGLNAAAMLSTFRADPKNCHADENPMACEYRVHNPSIAIISLEEWWAGEPEKYEMYMRKIIEYTIQQGIVPILATKADNLEGDNSINQTLYNLAWEYDIPLWNFWAAVQPIPNHGLLEDGFHLTQGSYFNFDALDHNRTGWMMRNLTALMALDVVRRELNK